MRINITLHCSSRVSGAWLWSASIAAGINRSSCNQQKLEPEEKWKRIAWWHTTGGSFGCHKIATIAYRLISVLLFQWIIFKSQLQLTLIFSVVYNKAVPFKVHTWPRGWWPSSLSAPATLLPFKFLTISLLWGNICMRWTGCWDSITETNVLVAIQYSSLETTDKKIFGELLIVWHFSRRNAKCCLVPPSGNLEDFSAFPLF